MAKPNPRPNDFEGNIVVAEIKSLENKDETNGATVKTLGLENKSQEKQTKTNNIEKSQTIEESKTDNSLLDTVEYKSLKPLSQKSSATMEEDLDLLAFLPSFNIEQEQKANDHKDNVIKTAEMDQVTQFFQWLQDGIKKGSLKTNQAKARIHIVDEGVILITPGIFQDFAKTKDKENDDWTAIQQKVLKKNWHVRNDKGLNVVKYQVKGKSKQTTMNAVLFNDVSKVFGTKKASESNPHLTKMD